MADIKYGHELRRLHFSFKAEYVPLNHGSYGAFPSIVKDRQRKLQALTEECSDPFIRYSIPKLLKESREAVAPLLGVAVKEVVFVPNATTGVNTVLRNLKYDDGDVIIYLSTAYGACEKTILHICETTSASFHRITVPFPIEDGDFLALFDATLNDIREQGKNPRIAMFDTVATFPGVRLPFEQLVGACRASGILSLVDGAHGLGHIDLTHLGTVGPDFFTSNCYKWLYTPRPCAVLHVPKRNWSLMRTTFPTSHGFVTDELAKGSRDPLGDLFYWAATLDMTPYLCVPQALDFRKDVLGGEDKIRQYCFGLAKDGGRTVANTLGTEVLDNKSGTLSQCCFAMIRLPIQFDHESPSIGHSNTLTPSLPSAQDGPAIVKWIMETLMTDHNTWVPGKFFQGAAWVRISAQTYLELSDFEWIASILKDLSARVMTEDVLRTKRT
ncbi:Hercynylcysteine sulfoxide lyase-like protein 2 [Elsinoe fawcettii]|nr:Hercynylcysteine sulfoxide lyase-like protein 2 [Elsinoe fawcettii]